MIEGIDLGPNLSEQQAIDCVGSAEGFASKGCDGGYYGVPACCSGK